MEERTADEIAAIFSAAGDSVTLINADANYAAYVTRTGSTDTEDEWKDMIKRNVEHLEIIKAYKKLDETTSIWTSEDFTDIDAAITSGKTLYS
jgi:metal-dependent amidase/aminoacylase/carboxypeptidase family protein